MFDSFCAVFGITWIFYSHQGATVAAPKEVADLIAGSGNNFHAKVARWFQSAGWYTIISPYYMDQTHGKAREIDLVTEKTFDIVRRGSREWLGQLVVRLFIECKYVPPNPAVFWFADKDMTEANVAVRASGIFPPGLSRTTDIHHYVSSCPRVAKVFSSAGKTAEQDLFYKALNQSLQAFVSMRDVHTQSHTHSPDVGIKRRLDFPVVVCSSFDSMWEVDFFSDSDPRTIAENFQLEVRYAYVDRWDNNRDDYFLLDFVQYRKLEEFALKIEADANAALIHLQHDN